MSDPRALDGTDLGAQAGELISQWDWGFYDVWMNPAAGIAVSGTWTPGIDSVGVPELARTAAAADEVAVIPLDAHTPYHYRGVSGVAVPRAAESGKVTEIGLKPFALEVQYEVATADADDVRFLIQKVTLGADGSPAVVATLAGDDDADYDADHDTAVKRGDDTGAPELHTATITIPEGERALLLENEQLQIRAEVDNAGAASSVVTVKGAKVKCHRTLTNIRGTA